MKIAASITVLAAIGIFAVTALTPTNRAFAFEDFAREILKIETASYDLVTTVDHPDGRSKNLGTQKVVMKQPGLMRIEAAIGATIIMDFEKDKMLMLYTNEKVAITMEGIVSGFDAGADDAMFFGDIQDTIRQIENGENLDKMKYEALGEKEIGGSKAVGYRVRNIDEADGAEKAGDAKAQDNAADPFAALDIWADAKTGLILQMDARSPGLEGSTMTISYKNIIYNEKVDPKQLLMEVPAGYTQVDPGQGALLGAAESAQVEGTIENLPNALAIHAAKNEGKFPDTLSSNEIIGAIIEIWKKENPDKPVYKDAGKTQFTDEEFGAVVKLVNESFAIIRKLEADGVEYVYAGKGVLFGEKDRPILWYKAKGAKTYTVLYADTTVKQADVAPAKP